MTRVQQLTFFFIKTNGMN